MQTGDEVIVTPGTHDVGPRGVIVKNFVTSLNIHGQDGQPRPRIVATSTNFTLSTCALSSCVGNGTVLRHLAVENQGTGGALAFFGGVAANPFSVEDVEARAGSSSLAILAFAQGGVPSAAVIRNTTAYAPGAGSNISAIASELDLTMRQVTAVAPGNGAVALIKLPNCTPGFGCTGNAIAAVFNSILAGGPSGADVRTTSSTNGCGELRRKRLARLLELRRDPQLLGLLGESAGSAHNQTSAPLLVNRPAATSTSCPARRPWMGASMTPPTGRPIQMQPAQARTGAGHRCIRGWPSARSERGCHEHHDNIGMLQGSVNRIAS